MSGPGQAPIIRLATERGDLEAGRRAETKKSGRGRYEWVSAAEARSAEPRSAAEPAKFEFVERHELKSHSGDGQIVLPTDP